MRVQRFHYLAGIAFGALFVAAPVHAEDWDNSHDIIVTANKRPERLQDVASSVSVVTGGQLLQQHLTSLSDYARTIPGLNIGNGGSPANSEIILRGIVPNGGGALVGTYIDDSPVGSSGGYNFAAITALDLPPYELQQIEVLRGPQGTLYGAGAMGGLVKYELTPASTSRYSLQAGADVGAVADAGGVEASGRAAINIPLIKDVLGIRVSGFENHKPGYVDNAGTGQKNANSGDSYGGRVALQFTPTDTFTAKANAFLFRSKYDDLGWVTYTNPTLRARSDNAYILTRGTASGGLTTDHNFPDVSGKNLNFFSLNMEWKPGPVNVVSATSWAHSKYYASLDETLAYGAYLPLLTGGAVTQGYALGTEKASLNKLVQEVRVSSPDGPHPIEWMIGGFYTHEKAVLDEPAYAFDADHQLIPSLQPDIARFYAPSTYQEEAVFGNLTWHITDSFDVSGGVRYAHNKQNVTEYLSGVLYGGGLTIPGASHESVTTWMADARYHFSKDVIAYARVATGYRPGGSNALTPGETVPATYNSDKLTNYEGGVKASFADNRGFLDISGFFIDWSDIQLNLYQNGYGYFANAGKAHSSGFEASASYSPLHGMSVGGNVALTDAKVVKLNPGSAVMTGYQLPLVPKLSFTALAAYDWAVGGEWKAHFGGDVHWVGRTWSNPVTQYSIYGSPSTRLPAYATVDFDANVVHGRFTYRLFLRNVTNKHALQATTYIANALRQPVQANYSINQPRTIGVGFDVAF